MYHRFPADEVANLESQCRHLRRHYRPVTMGAIAESVSGGKTLPPRAVVVTVDDGYSDFAENAAGVFEKFGIPATIFPITSFLEHKQWPWWDVVAFAIERTSHAIVELNGERIPLDTHASRSATIERLCQRLKNIPNNQRLCWIERLGDNLGVSVPRAIPSDCTPLSWDQARRLRAEGFEFGAHTHSHPILSKIETVEELRREVHGCKVKLEEELDTAVIHFCYPNGRPEDLDSRVVREVSAAGYKTAVTSVGERNDRSESPLLLRRYAIYNSMPLPHFSQLLAGMHDEPHADLRGLLPQESPEHHPMGQDAVPQGLSPQ